MSITYDPRPCFIPSKQKFVTFKSTVQVLKYYEINYFVSFGCKCSWGWKLTLIFFLSSL